MKKIMIALEYASSDACLINTGIALARAFDGSMRLLHVAPGGDQGFIGYGPGPQSTRDALAAELRVRHEHILQKAQKMSADLVPTDALMAQGPIPETIAEQVHGWEAELLVMGDHKRGLLTRVLAGRLHDGVLKHIQCPVLVVPVTEEGQCA